MGRNRISSNYPNSRSSRTQVLNWLRGVMLISGGTFILAIIVSLASEFFLRSVTSLLLAFLILLTIILIGVVFDAIGVAAAAAQEPPFHAKAADRIRGASEAVQLVRRADRVSSFCNDVVGDVCGTISGAIGAMIALRLLYIKPTMGEMAVTVVMTGLIAALTVGGKAAGKTFAINQANDIIFRVGQTISWFKRITGWSRAIGGKRGKKRTR